MTPTASTLQLPWRKRDEGDRSFSESSTWQRQGSPRRSFSCRRAKAPLPFHFRTSHWGRSLDCTLFGMCASACFQANELMVSEFLGCTAELYRRTVQLLCVMVQRSGHRVTQMYSQDVACDFWKIMELLQFVQCFVRWLSWLCKPTFPQIHRLGTCCLYEFFLFFVFFFVFFFIYIYTYIYIYIFLFDLSFLLFFFSSFFYYFFSLRSSVISSF